jgi:UDP-3-O-acyl-N-acetylglucosamine deacetylase
LILEPTTEYGWHIDRMDLPDSLPIPVSVSAVWTTARNIVLRSGSPHNYMRMVEHIIALKLGLRVDNLVIQMNSGDPPLFDRGSMDLVEAFNEAGTRPVSAPVTYWTVREPVTVGGPNGSFLVFQPCEGGDRVLKLDCAVNFPTAIGRQRIQTTVDDTSFSQGAQARTNTTFARMLFTRTIGLLFADFRNLGYTTRNIVIAGRHGYYNEAKLVHNGKSLEAVWHRAMMDLVAALALIDEGRFVGTVLSYKAGHTLDVVAIKHIYQNNLFVQV